MALTHPLKGKSGFSLLEVLIAAGAMSVIAMGLISLVQSLMRTESHTKLSSNITTVNNNIVAYINNSTAWTATIAANSSMACLSSHTDCSAYSSVSTAFSLYDPNGTLYVSSAATGGFTRMGTVCGTGSGSYIASPSTGNTNCPLHYSLTWKALCQAGVSVCVDPQILITGTLSYNSGVNELRPNTDSYAISLIRNKTVYLGQVILLQEQTTGAPPVACSTANEWQARGPMTIITDGGGNVSSVGTTAAQFTLAAGTYQCTVTAPAFRIGMTQLRLYDVSGSTTAAVGPVSYASQNAYSTVMTSLTTVLTPSTSTTYRVDQYCQYAGQLTATAGQTCTTTSCDLGVPMFQAGGSSYANPQIFGEVSCVRTL